MRAHSVAAQLTINSQLHVFECGRFTAIPRCTEFAQHTHTGVVIITHTPTEQHTAHSEITSHRNHTSQTTSTTQIETSVKDSRSSEKFTPTCAEDGRHHSTVHHCKSGRCVSRASLVRYRRLLQLLARSEPRHGELAPRGLEDALFGLQRQQEALLHDALFSPTAGPPRR